MQYDIAALQRMYGADLDTNAGNTIYRWTPAGSVIDGTDGALRTYMFNSSGVLEQKSFFDAPNTDNIFMTVWDASAIDTFDFRNYTGYTDELKVDIRPGGWI
jgi:serralysin